jgi:hypothetical protein
LQVEFLSIVLGEDRPCPTRQLRNTQNFAVKSAEADALHHIFTSIAERVFKRHFENHRRFKKLRDSPKSEEEDSPLTSASEDEGIESEDDDKTDLVAVDRPQVPRAILYDPDSYEDLFARTDNDCIYHPRFLSTSCGGSRLLRKRWLYVHAESVLVNPQWMQNYTQKYFKATAYSTPSLDPSGFSVGVPPIRTLDHFDFKYEVPEDRHGPRFPRVCQNRGYSQADFSIRTRRRTSLRSAGIT